MTTIPAADQSPSRWMTASFHSRRTLDSAGFARLGNFTQLPISLQQRLRHRHLTSCKHVLELKRIYRRFALKVIVGDDEGLLRFAGDSVNASFPSCQFRLGVKIVVTIVARVAVKPLLIIAPVQADVADGRGDMLCRGDR